MTEVSQARTSTRWVLPFLAALIAALAAILLGTTASASAAGVAETRVGAFNVTGEVLVGPPEHITAGQRLGESAPQGDFVVATGVAADSAAPLIKAGSEGGESAGKAFSQRIRQEALEENPSTCVYCHMETDSPQIDHAIPRSRGGNATIENAQTTCGWCNASKGARDFPVNPPPGFEGMWPPSWWGFLF